MNASFEKFLKSEMEKMEALHLKRELSYYEACDGAVMNLNGQRFLQFASNSYLDLGSVAEIREAMSEALARYGTGSGGSRLITGGKEIHRELEKALAAFKGTEDALLFNTGYMANLGVISALCQKDDFIFSDRLNHASIIDGIRLSKASVFVYAHNDLKDLERLLIEAGLPNSSKKALIVSDGVFSMDGDLADLPGLLKLSKKYGALLMLDEAHATGVVGKKGHGLAEHFGCENPDIVVGTLSKALFCEGGFVAGKKRLIEFLYNKARSFIYTTAMSPCVAAGGLAALRYLDTYPERVLKLAENSAFFRAELKKRGLNVTDFPSAIIIIELKKEELALTVSKELKEKGLLIPAVRFPTVPKGKACLRASVMATHEKEDLIFAAETIAQCIKSAQSKNEGNL